MNKVNKNDRCRVFIQDVENKSWQFFSLEQRKKDGSIYLGSPEFTSFEWLTFEIKDSKLNTFKISQDIEGHLSIHGSGRAHVKSDDRRCKLVISGQYLLRPTENDISLRHLFTLFPKKPEHLPKSEALKRKGDQLLISSEKLRPFVIIGFALPSIGLKIHFMMSFNVDDLETLPGVMGFHLFPLVHHDVLLVFYRTKHMNDWPKRIMVQYLDGVTVPIFIGKPERIIEMQLYQPAFKLLNKELEINLSPLIKQELV